MVLFDFSTVELLLILTTIVIAYIIFGIAGFGTALIASPILTIYLPLSQIVPLLALLDMLAAINNIHKDGKKAERYELKRLIPLIIIGSLVGATILLKTHPVHLLLALGIFIILYSLYSLSGFKSNKKFSNNMVFPFGFIGGIFSALFGSGGFIYAIYLSGRLEEKNKIRMTQTVLIGFSTLTRVTLFTLAGVYANQKILWLAALMFPAMIIGVYIGRHITIHLTKEQFLKIINILIFFSGCMLLGKYFL